MLQIVLLAGGLGTRLQSVAPDTPKAIVPVAGRPFIEHQFELLRKHGLTRALLCIGHFGEKIIAHVGDGSKFGMQVSYIQEDPKSLLGTGGALVNALPEIESEFAVMYGDSYLPVDYRDFVEKSRAQNRRAVMSVYRNGGLWDSSNTRIEGDRVVFYSKKSRPGECDFIDYGLTYFRREVIESYRSHLLPLDMATIQGGLVERGEMGAWEAPVRFYEIGKPEGLAELDAYLRGHGSNDWKSTGARLPETGTSR
jgi:NDP-sugar pyrophosphorylase family protein